MEYIKGNEESKEELNSSETEILNLLKNYCSECIKSESSVLMAHHIFLDLNKNEISLDDFKNYFIKSKSILSELNIELKKEIELLDIGTFARVIIGINNEFYSKLNFDKDNFFRKIIFKYKNILENKKQN